jgi:hypothetical protein
MIQNLQKLLDHSKTNLGGEGAETNNSCGKVLLQVTFKTTRFSLLFLSLILLRIKALLNLESIGSGISSAVQIRDNIRNIVIRIRKNMDCRNRIKIKSFPFLIEMDLFERCCCLS